jgi:hypothetical protein
MLTDDYELVQQGLASRLVQLEELRLPCLFPSQKPDADGYVRISQGYGKHKLAHVLAWEAANGPVPAGLELDHLCNVRSCKELTHLEAVTKSENLRRIWVRKPKTHCKNGHEFTVENTIERAGGHRYCRICRTAYRQRYNRP